MGILPRLGWNNMPAEVMETIKSYNCMWNFYGKFVEYENNAEADCGYRNNFFIMKLEDRWRFRMKTYHGYGHDFFEAFKPPVPRKRFHYFQNFKDFGHEKDIWTSEELFMKRYQDRNPLTMQTLYEKFIIKYETVFNWLYVSFNKREAFWQNIKRDFEGKSFGLH
jgi:hypothetical protein